MNLILIGNGFDLAHGLETSFANFINSLKNECAESKSHTAFYNYLSGRVVPKNLFIKSVESKRNENWADLEGIYFDELNNLKDPKEFNNAFAEIKTQLQKYLFNQQSKSKKIQTYDILFHRLSEQDHTIVLDFNYTDTIDYYGEHFNRVIPIHGRLKDKSNPIIFGYGAEQRQVQSLLDLRDDAFLENIKQFEYLKSSNNTELYNLFEGAEIGSINVILLGHSCGLSDQNILDYIFRSKSVIRIYNLYYKGMSDHVLKFNNVSRISGQDVAFLKYQPFPFCFKMPQHVGEINERELEMFIEILNRN